MNFKYEGHPGQLPPIKPVFTLQWFPIATAPVDGIMYLATDWEQFRNENHPRGHLAGYWYNSENDWRGSAHTDSFKATHWTPLPIKPKHLKG